MAAGPPPTPADATPSTVVAAWPRSAQLTVAFLLGLVTALLTVQVCSYCRWAARPAELERAGGLAYRIDLNTAPRTELVQVPGIGPSLADRIEEYRQARGGFRAVEELTQINGVGPATLERVRPWVGIGQPVAMHEERPGGPQPPAMPAAPRQKVGGTHASKKAAALTGKIDVNHAGSAELQRLPGVGPKMAQRILDERARRLFASVDDLRRVSGIGPRVLERLRPYVRVEVRGVHLAANSD